MAPRLIGICGDIGSGKSSVADYLERRHGYRLLPWSAPLKAIAFQTYGPLGAKMKHFYGTQAEKAEPIPGIMDAAGVTRTGRSILEWLGDEGFRTVDPDTWVKYAMATVRAFPDVQWAFPDVRYENEMKAIRARGGVVWEVTRVGGPDHGKRDHPSDQRWRLIQKDAHLVARFGDLESLYYQVDEELQR